ncbi:Brp/Blh family beta-carotene 15,15'-dioxygenase [Marinobacter sp. LV10MA510-1]|uniref:Brp/Blh family beta-carotene 15,15'-dioxygenase n=1 Tax=Marinobacter sp. LV10MA510-1 TaxID=1415567 RepID=UPI000BF9D324|nr:Brp/Blh family beta-carotene 15,15'-dioxygenase [Marinobacter sp. LV10MA510-1]PFG09593.1 Brp/Blh family beta-carotene 15,15'-monooxygenase [Marinobacter sp. LV10MA510-1]
MVINDNATTDNVLYRSSGGRRHQRVILTIASLALIVGVMLPALSIEQQFWIVLLPIGVFGLSHGGADPMILKKLTATSSSGLFVVLCAYLMASLAFVALIWVLPVVALLVFLGLSIWHFGYTDEAFLSSAKNPLLLWLSGSMPILGPILGHPQQTSELFAWLIKMETPVVLDILVWLGPCLAVLWLLGFGYLLIGRLSRPDPRVLLELCLVGAVLIALPPLLGFAFYFCAIHSVRHFLSIAEHRLLSNQKSLFQAFPVGKVLPATLGAIAMACVAWGVIVLIEPAPSLFVEAVRVMFWALAALTLPHAIIVRLWWSQRLSE